MTFEVHHGHCLDVLKTFPDNSFDSIVTDPPYGISFMGKKWDYDVPSVEEWAECLRVLKPGGHLLAFAGTRTQHRMAVRIEDAGFEIRDMIAWVYGSGFPKSLDVSKAIDKSAGVDREIVGITKGMSTLSSKSMMRDDSWVPVGNILNVTAPSTDAARQWQGWGTALKPAMEPITVARKPLTGTVATNVLEWGTGAINIDGCRVGDSKQVPVSNSDAPNNVYGASSPRSEDRTGMNPNIGRWPANLIHDGSDEVARIFPNSKGSGSSRMLNRGERRGEEGWGMGDHPGELRDAGTGSAVRFFYCAKASKTDRGEGNDHPTVKPTDLMRYLCRLVTPPGGRILDPWVGSGSTGKAAIPEGFEFVGIERDIESVETARRRIGEVAAKANLTNLFE